MTHSKQPLVSAIMIFLNAAQFIQEAIDSVCAQTYDQWELLLVDDGSTDGSTEIARQYAQARRDKVRYLEHEGHRNRGMSASRNLGIQNARGEFIAFLDADDVWLPQKLEAQVPILESQPQTGMLYARSEYWHSWTGVPEDLDRDHVPDLDVPLDTVIEPPKLLTLLYPLGHGQAPCMCSLLVRRGVFERIGGFEESFSGYFEDQAFLTKVYLTEAVFVSSGCWDRYRIHAGSCSAAVARSGQHDSYRRSYFEWFKRFLLSRGVADTDIWKAVDDAQRTSDQAHDKLRRKWFLRVAEGNQARLISAENDSDVVRIEISKNISNQNYDTQLNLPSLKIAAKERCVLNFHARADEPRTISFGVAMAHSPWSNLGLHESVELTTAWQRFEREFVVNQDEHDARVHFDVGGGESSVEISSLTLLSASEGRFVEQAHMTSPAGEPFPHDVPVEPTIAVNNVEFGSFRRLTPISRDFGCDRGRPIDRYYIESFLERQSADVRGCVLEVGENTYTRRFGGERVSKSDVLHVTAGEPQATVIADLSSADHIPSDSFDCIILTQTLQLIFDVPAAIRTIRRILRPAGVLLATFPGISQSYDHEWASTWYWNFTAVSAKRLFEDVFSAENVAVEAFGNVLAAICFLHGLAVDELSPKELDYREPGYDVTITVRAVKPRNGEHRKSEARDNSSLRHAFHQGLSSVSPSAIVLMYHRVAEGCTDPFSLCVTPRNFAEQLEVLRRYTAPMRLSEITSAFNRGDVSRPAAIVTFDDGYADNFYDAKPLLQRYEIPATVFVTTAYVGGQREFWWEELDRLLLQPGSLPPYLRLSVNGITHEWDLGDVAHYSAERWQREGRCWTALERAPSARQSIFLAVWKLLQFLPDLERFCVLEELRKWAGAPPGARPSHRPLSKPEVIELARGDLVEVGAHTVTHPVLASLTAERQREEVQQSKARLEEILGRRITSFAYPFGSSTDYTGETIAIVKKAGFACACSTVSGAVRRDADLFQVPRLQVGNWDGDEFARRFLELVDAKVVNAKR